MEDISAQELEAATNGKYRIEGLIGRGGMGAVYLGVHRELGSKVAIKILPPEVRERPDRLARFRREAAVAANFSHPNLVPVFELDSATELTYLVMPFIDGETLDQFVARQGALTWEQTMDLVRSAGGALSHAHQRGVIHRDIKPANLLRERATGRWLVTDFGVAHVTAPAETELTGTEATIGTLAYMAPEQLGGARTVDARADLYALATVAFEALTGELPEREGAERARRQLMTRRPDISVTLARALTTGLAEARDERPATMDVWVQALGPRRRADRARRTALGALGVVAVVAFAIIATRQNPLEVPSPVIAVLPFQLQTADSGLGTLDSLLPQLVTWEIQRLSGYRVLEDTRVRTAIRRRFGETLPPRDSLFEFLSGELGVTEAVVGTATSADDSLTLRLEVYDPARRTRLDAGEHTGLAAALSQTISQVVIDAFATRLAEAWSGSSAPSIPSGLDAIAAYFEGDRAFRRGALDDALDRFNETIALDSTYAPAYLKRILATAFNARPTVAITDVRTAVAQAAVYRDNLDPASQRLLAAFTAAAIRGDLPEADSLIRTIVDDYPDAVDAWFLMGALRTIFPSLTGTTPQEARYALDQALARDPTFVAAYGLMIQIAIAENRPEDARRPITQFLAVDSTSTNAQLVRLTDTLLRFPTRVADISASLPRRPREVLENLALVVAEFHPPPGGRAIGAAAIQALRSTAATPADRTLAFRLRLATHLGSGEFGAARTLLASAPAAGVAPEELDRWRVVGYATAAPVLTTPEEAAAAAARLGTHGDDPVLNRWLAARWALLTGGPIAATRRNFDTALSAPRADSVFGESLRLDLDALGRLAAGDTAAALTLWTRALRRVSLERVLFGFAGSLWPLRADLATVALATGADSTSRRVARHFDRRTGVMDQVVWETVMLAGADAARRLGDRPGARSTYEALLQIWSHGTAHPLRDSVLALQAEVSR